MLSFLQNKINPIYKEGLVQTDAEYLYNIMIENPTIVIEIKGFRDKSEKKSVSYKRADKFAKKVIALGVDKDRILVTDGGIGTEKWMKENILTDPHYSPIPLPIDQIRTITTKVVRSNYIPKK